MAAGRIELVIQLITALSVIVGIVLVTVELRQNRAISRAQFAAGAADLAAARAHGIFGEEMAETLVRACYEPEAMTKADAVRLNEYFRSISMVVARYAGPADIAGLATPWQRLARYPYGLIAGYPNGREWLLNLAERVGSAEHARLIREVAADTSVRSCKREMLPLLPSSTQ